MYKFINFLNPSLKVKNSNGNKEKSQVKPGIGNLLKSLALTRSQQLEVKNYKRKSK